MVASDFGNDGSRLESAALRHGRVTGAEEYFVFGVSSREIGAGAVADIELSVKNVLDRAGVALPDVRWIVMHQPNGPMLDAFMKRLGIGEERTNRVVGEIGSAGAASVGFSFDRLWRSGQVQGGDHVLLAAVGAGSSRGAVLFRVAS